MTVLLKLSLASNINIRVRVFPSSVEHLKQLSSTSSARAKQAAKIAEIQAEAFDLKQRQRLHETELHLKRQQYELELKREELKLETEYARLKLWPEREHMPRQNQSFVPLTTCRTKRALVLLSQFSSPKINKTQ